VDVVCKGPRERYVYNGGEKCSNSRKIKEKQLEHEKRNKTSNRRDGKETGKDRGEKK
jgi:hypothetical protein